MLIYSLFTLVISLIYHIDITFAQSPIIGTQVHVRPKTEGKNETDNFSRDNSITMFSSRRSTDLYYVTRSTTLWPPIPTKVTNAFPLIDSDCFCSYDLTINLLLCSPLFQTSSSYSLSDTNIPLINITLNDCTFATNRLNLPINLRKNIDQLRLYNVNYQNYLVLDATSFSSRTINHMYIIYSYSQPITMLLISNETFSSSSISLSLRTLYITSCYLVALNQTLNRLFLLESITLKNIDQFSWYDFQQQIIHLPKLRYIYITEEILSLTSDIFNAISCQDISSKWIFSYRSTQTCSCKFMSFLRTVRHVGDIYKCPNSDNPIDFIDNICQFNGKEYEIHNQTDLFCNKCSNYQCRSETLCAEAFDSEPNCLPLSRYDYETIRNRIPLTPYTMQFLFQESQGYLSRNPNQTLEPNGFHSVATILIDSNQNRLPDSLSDVQMFHQTFSDMLNRPWSLEIYNSPRIPSEVWQQLLISLDGSIENIKNNDSKFLFQSKPISTMSLRLSQDQQSQETFGWKITHDNQITENITNSQAIDKTVTSRVFLQLNHIQQYRSNCDTS
jgi:hypothetical protein